MAVVKWWESEVSTAVNFWHDSWLDETEAETEEEEGCGGFVAQLNLDGEEDEQENFQLKQWRFSIASSLILSRPKAEIIFIAPYGMYGCLALSELTLMSLNSICISRVATCKSGPTTKPNEIKKKHVVRFIKYFVSLVECHVTTKKRKYVMVVAWY